MLGAQGESFAAQPQALSGAEGTDLRFLGVIILSNKDPDGKAQEYLALFSWIQKSILRKN